MKPIRITLGLVQYYNGMPYIASRFVTEDLLKSWQPLEKFLLRIGILPLLFLYLIHTSVVLTSSICYYFSFHCFLSIISLTHLSRLLSHVTSEVCISLTIA